MSLGESSVQTLEGRVKDGRLMADVSTFSPGAAKKTNSFRMAFRKRIGGFESEERSLRMKPLKPAVATSPASVTVPVTSS